jgi:hypothetical protein
MVAGTVLIAFFTARSRFVVFAFHREAVAVAHLLNSTLNYCCLLGTEQLNKYCFETLNSFVGTELQLLFI